MAWVRLDDAFPEHPKVIEVGGDAAWLHVCALAYCNRNLTDGKITEGALPRLSDRRHPAKLARLLVAVGLWDETDGGWVIHDYLDFQPSKAKVDAERRAARERMANNRNRSNNVRPNIDRSSPYPDPDPTRSRPVEVQVPAPPPVSTPSADTGGGGSWINQVVLAAAEHLYTYERAGTVGNRAGWVHRVAQRLLAEHGAWLNLLPDGMGVDVAANELSGRDRGWNGTAPAAKEADDRNAGAGYGRAVAIAHVEDGMVDRDSFLSELDGRPVVWVEAAVAAYDDEVARPTGLATVHELRQA
jgi:hypothetical protein